MMHVPKWCVCLVAVSGCTVDPFHLSEDTEIVEGELPEGDGKVGGGNWDGGRDGLDADGAGDAGTSSDACIPLPERCDSVDNDCDGLVDEGFDLAADPANCGICGRECALPNMNGTCVGGECALSCQSGYVDLDGDATNGCEYMCTPTAGGSEVCDLGDNDCDGEVDEGIDLMTDIDNCGACGRLCRTLNATPVCEGGDCGFESCSEGFADLLPLLPGCEYACPEYPPADEICDHVDNDCDGSVDEDNPGGGLPCGSDVGACLPGVYQCTVGVVSCVGAKGPTSEICDELDNDCDGFVDEEFAKENDPGHCGGCTPCSLPNAIAGCELGACTIVGCLAGSVDADGLAENGCEYACTKSGGEVCDGRDNDCDTFVDTSDPDLVTPTNFCADEGPCAGILPVCGASACDSHSKWRCLYGGGAETDECGDLLVEETRCDGIDGDCDGKVDESYPAKGTACDDGLIGRCRGTGQLICADSQVELACAITTPGAEPVSEECNGVDDDCDGEVDDGAPDDMAYVSGYWIYKYEAARPDATTEDEGSLEHRACSRAQVLPWRNVTWDEAHAACLAAGKRLCTEEEWQLACEGPLAQSYPYGNAYLPLACNGADYDPDCVEPDDDVCIPTGSVTGCPDEPESSCESPFGVMDMSGNLKEWTATEVAGSSPSYRIRGGAFDNIAFGLTCQFDFIAAEIGYWYGNLGFRCCADAVP